MNDNGTTLSTDDIVRFLFGVCVTEARGFFVSWLVGWLVRLVRLVGFLFSFCVRCLLIFLVFFSLSFFKNLKPGSMIPVLIS